jgi:hypothetical protein
MNIRRKSITCWNVLSVERLTVFRPANVMALTTRKRASVKWTLFAGVEAPQNMTALKMQVQRK